MGLYEDALELYFKMVEEEEEPDQYTFPAGVKSLWKSWKDQFMEEVHRQGIRTGFGNNPFVLNELVDIYTKCGDII